MKNHLIYLIGFMGTGKSTVSGYLHARFGLDRLEMDREIARRAGKSISAIFGEDGEEVFRDMETELLRELSQKENLVVSCGGGTVLRDENVRLMKASGTLILLDASAEEI